ncbi:cupin domain-containing protein [Pseudoflavonifractor sp. HCP28S3_F10]|uniref:cupin domain-containing protein n=1 Tax=Pseudoflavonifractor sp. HCP28S3_F10 TaxID=3438947 RepID=UPI002A86A74C|nr:cupin domain-containing protein [Clostridiales bacterium]MDY4180523.1 cupin domain-containing protein [Pseudoflavonifractor sp.]
MIIDFEQMETKHLEHFKGGEKSLNAKMHVDENNKILFGTLEPGASVGYHLHETDSEIIYILRGHGTVRYDEGSEQVREGQCHYCPKGHSHGLINDSGADLVFFAVVPTHS